MSKDISENFGKFVEQLSNNTSLSRGQAEVYTLRKAGHSRQEVAELLDSTVETVDSQYSKAKSRLNQLGGSTKGTHFFPLESSDVQIPLLWDNTVISDEYGLFLSDLLLELVESDYTEVRPDERVVSIVEYSDEGQSFGYIHKAVEKNGVHYIVFDNVEQLLAESGLSYFVGLVETNGQRMNLLWELLNGADVTDSPFSFVELVLSSRDKRASPKFYSNLDFELRLSTMLVVSWVTETDTIDVGYSKSTLSKVSLDEYWEEDWISIVGEIGSGKTFSKDVLLANLLPEFQDDAMVSFEPINTSENIPERFKPNEYVTYTSPENAEISSVVNDFCEKTLKTLESESTLVVIDEAHYIIQNEPEMFVEIVEAVQADEDSVLITATQTFDEFKQMEVSQSVYDTPLWFFHQMQGQNINLSNEYNVQQVVQNLGKIGERMKEDNRYWSDVAPVLLYNPDSDMKPFLTLVTPGHMDA